MSMVKELYYSYKIFVPKNMRTDYKYNINK